jgi:hypothetical protein
MRRCYGPTVPNPERDEAPVDSLCDLQVRALPPLPLRPPIHPSIHPSTHPSIHPSMMWGTVRVMYSPSPSRCPPHPSRCLPPRARPHAHANASVFGWCLNSWRISSWCFSSWCFSTWRTSSGCISSWRISKSVEHSQATAPDDRARRAGTGLAKHLKSESTSTAMES